MEFILSLDLIGKQVYLEDRVCVGKYEHLKGKKLTIKGFDPVSMPGSPRVSFIENRLTVLLKDTKLTFEL